MTRAILTRIERSLEETESPTQAGFRRSHSTLNNIHVLKQIAEKSREYRFPVYIALVDFQKAFDTVEWPAVWTALARRAVHAELITMLRRLYESSSTSIFVNSILILLSIGRGVKQGKQLQTLEYADDVTLLSTSRPMLGKMFELLTKATSKDFLSFGPNGRNFSTNQSGWNVFKKLEIVLCSKTALLNLKKRAFDSCVTLAVLYGSETWSLQRSHVAKLNVTQKKIERYMLGLTLNDKWSNERIRNLTKLKDWSNEATRRKLRWAQKIRSMKEEEWAKEITLIITYVAEKEDVPH
ncbi:hypothetical protein OESDEN_06128 [Oesophagostomum dentatum]|uniref:Uncharacterized protein n=1 Tax=Oesophagostomum dentatum TaxID=61180 RepID=A0A0B1TEY0_OESDE|nr:hypothetical protein OESDEN_06128 [Oesophagostomum dentatum]